ncbi:ABC transporter substrate-binding protein [Acrocarpospora macrocephala]|uniref:ABC transporter substrate-binding protein n=1 Tax=Acrocarpospora macrocephala TaxID=150177 RepID=A0A5M3WJU9_9ACTN|nr:ABC transporter substrate-binding protein [Acrocarpospora macrocephala]GES08439.1 ABC transporter substrate-binding protein [Acrocarpospora macrocephala]
MSRLGQLNSLDSALCSSSAYYICAALYGTLARYSFEDQKFEPAMAESFESADGKVWTLKLRSGTKFTDGTPYDAEAVAFNWERLKDPALLSFAGYWLSQMTWKVVDPLTLEITLASTNYQFPWALQYDLGSIGSPTAIKAKGEKFATEPVGAGPFVVDTWVPGSQIQLKRNPGYVEKGLPYLDRITYATVVQDDQRVNALRAGQVDLTATFLKRFGRELQPEGYGVHAIPLFGGTGLGFNLKDPIIADPDLRQALLHAFNAPQLTAAAYPGDEPPDAFFPKNSPYRDAAVTYPKFDLTEAQRLFDAYLAKTGKTSLDLEMLTYSPAPIMKQVGEVVAAQLNKINGLHVELKPTENAVISRLFREGKFQISVHASVISQSPVTVYRTLYTGGDLNVYGYSNPRVDTALDTTIHSTDANEVAEAWKVVGAEISKDVPNRLFAYEQDVILAAKHVHGVNPVTLYAASPELLWVDK